MPRNVWNYRKKRRGNKRKNAEAISSNEDNLMNEDNMSDVTSNMEEEDLISNEMDILDISESHSSASSIKGSPSVENPESSLPPVKKIKTELPSIEDSVPNTVYTESGFPHSTTLFPAAGMPLEDHVTIHTTADPSLESRRNIHLNLTNISVKEEVTQNKNYSDMSESSAPVVTTELRLKVKEEKELEASTSSVVTCPNPEKKKNDIPSLNSLNNSVKQEILGDCNTIDESPKENHPVGEVSALKVKEEETVVNFPSHISGLLPPATIRHDEQNVQLIPSVNAVCDQQQSVEKQIVASSLIAQRVKEVPTKFPDVQEIVQPHIEKNIEIVDLTDEVRCTTQQTVPVPVPDNVPAFAFPTPLLKYMNINVDLKLNEIKRLQISLQKIQREAPLPIEICISDKHILPLDSTPKLHLDSTPKLHLDSTDIQPASIDIQPDSAGIHPDSSAIKPDSTGIHPDSSAIKPDSTGIQPSNNKDKVDTKVEEIVDLDSDEDMELDSGGDDDDDVIEMGVSSPLLNQQTTQNTSKIVDSFEQNPNLSTENLINILQKIGKTHDTNISENSLSDNKSSDAQNELLNFRGTELNNGETEYRVCDRNAGNSYNILPENHLTHGHVMEKTFTNSMLSTPAPNKRPRMSLDVPKIRPDLSNARVLPERQLRPIVMDIPKPSKSVRLSQLIHENKEVSKGPKKIPIEEYRKLKSPRDPRRKVTPLSTHPNTHQSFPQAAIHPSFPSPFFTPLTNNSTQSSFPRDPRSLSSSTTSQSLSAPSGVAAFSPQIGASGLSQPIQNLPPHVNELLESENVQRMLESLTPTLSTLASARNFSSDNLSPQIPVQVQGAPILTHTTDPFRNGQSESSRYTPQLPASVNSFSERSSSFSNIPLSNVINSNQIPTSIFSGIPFDTSQVLSLVPTTTNVSSQHPISTPFTTGASFAVGQPVRSNLITIVPSQTAIPGSNTYAAQATSQGFNFTKAAVCTQASVTVAPKSAQPASVNPRLMQFRPPLNLIARSGQFQPSQNFPTITNQPTRFVERKFVNLLPQSLKRGVGSNIIPTNDLYLIIIEWNIEWMTDTYKDSSAPSIASEFMHVRNSYSDFLDYYNTYFPLLLLECFCKIREVLVRVMGPERGKADKFDLQYKIFSFDQKQTYINVTCDAVIPSEMLEGIPNDGHIVLVTFATRTTGSIKMLGYIYKSENRPYSHSHDKLHETVKLLTVGNRLKLSKIKISFYIVYYSEEVDLNQLIIISKLSSIKNFLKQNNALQYLQISPLQEALLNPLKKDVSKIRLPLHNSDEMLSVVSTIVNSVHSTETKMTLLESPQSDNAMLFILQLVEQLQKCADNPPKVLICCRSGILNTLGLKLLNRCHNLVIVDREMRGKLKKELQRYALDRLVQDSVSTRGMVNDSAKQRVLMECNVLLASITNCFYEDMYLFAKNMNLDCCLIYEANLFTEPQSVLPLQYGIRNFILVGEEKEESARVSQLTRNYEYDKSMFHRASALCSE